MPEYSPAAVERYSEESLNNLFEPDVLLPSQFFAGGEGGVHGGERKLMAALLSDGIEAYLAQCRTTLGKGEAERKGDAREWVETRDYSYVFSFDSVCASLGIDPEYLRLGLYRYLQASNSSDASRVSPWKKIRRPRK